MENRRLVNYVINPTNGRKKGCGACGSSESNELMQLAGILPCDSEHSSLSGQVFPEGNDLPEVLQLDNVLVEAL